MGDLCQQFDAWAALLERKMQLAQARGDPTAELGLERVAVIRRDCLARTQKLGVPLCASRTTPAPPTLLVPACVRVDLTSRPCSVPVERSVARSVLLVATLVNLLYVLNRGTVSKLFGFDEPEAQWARTAQIAAAVLILLVQLASYFM